MASALEIVTDALNRIGAYAPGEPASSADAATGLSVLNTLVSSWQDENLPIYQLTSIDVTTVENQGAYTIGEGGDASVLRPFAIQMGPGQASYTHSSTTTAINVVSGVEWWNVEASADATGVSNVAYYDPTYPLGTLNVMPVPTAAGDTITVKGLYPLNYFPNLTTNYALSIGTELALRTNLAMLLKPYFLDQQLAPEIAQAAVEAKNALRYVAITSRAMMRRHMAPKPMPRATAV